jgi:glycosyltransferase involved in cell wall biosynthesis
MVCNLKSWEPFIAASQYTDAYDAAIAQGISVTICPIRKWSFPFDLFRAFLLVDRINPAIIHCNTATTFFTFVYALIARLKKIPFIWHSRVMDTAGWKDAVILKLSNKTIAISEAVKRKFGHSADTQKISVLYNAVDTKHFFDGMETAALRKTLGIANDNLVIGVFSRLDWWKGHMVLINAMRKTLDHINTDKVTLLIAGDGPCKDEITVKAQSTLIGHALLLNHRADVPHLMNLCDIVVTPSTEPEAFGRTIIEAMACGKPVIATNLGGPLEIITHGHDGFLSTPFAEPLAILLEMLILDPALRANIGANALNTVHKRFTVEKQIARLEKIYGTLN